TFDDDRHRQRSRGLLDRRDQIEIVLGGVHRRHEDVQPAVTWLDADRGTNDPFRRIAGTRGDLLHDGVAASGRSERRDRLLRARTGPARQRRLLRHWIRFVYIRIVFRRHPWQRVKRQPETDRRITWNQKQMLGPQKPASRHPLRRCSWNRVTSQRQYVADGAAQALL